MYEWLGNFQDGQNNVDIDKCSLRSATSRTEKHVTDVHPVVWGKR